MALTKALGGGGGGSSLTVKDEGSTLSAAVTSIDFVGAGVTATGTTAVTVTIPGGGLTAKYDVWDPFIPDTSPHALTDEFTNSATLSNWTSVNATTGGSVVCDIATSLRQGMFFQSTTVNYTILARMKSLSTITGGDFTIHTAVNLATAVASGGNATFAGILLADGTTAAAGKQTGPAIARSSEGVMFDGGRLLWANYGSGATSALYDTKITFGDAPFSFIRLRRVSGAYKLAFSSDGENWGEASMALLSGLTPTNFGLFFQNYSQSAEPFNARFAYFRVYTTGTQYKTGALRTVYG